MGDKGSSRLRAYHSQSRSEGNASSCLRRCYNAPSPIPWQWEARVSSENDRVDVLVIGAGASGAAFA